LYKIPANTLFMGHSVVFMPECHSTNDEASQLIESTNILEGTVVITHHQTSGRGQRGNTWVSEPGKNLTFSLLIKPAFLNAQDQFLLNKAFSLGLYDYLDGALKGAVKIKWPNDMVVNEKKICGILIENQIQGQNIQHSIVGIGLNVNQENFSMQTATSMKVVNSQEFILENVLPELLGRLETRYLQLRSGNLEEMNSDYLSALYWLGERHLFKKAEEIFEGTITGIDPYGKLKVNVDGTTEYFELKQIQFLK
jgi:BirA family biotin operon repressor/biotin-[acetyl-CoA-carboxylase] ligase